MQTTMFQPVGGTGMIGKAFARQVQTFTATYAQEAGDFQVQGEPGDRSKLLTGTPRSRGTINGTYTDGSLTLFAQGNVAGSGVYSATATPGFIANNPIPSVVTVDTTAQYEFQKTRAGDLFVYVRVADMLDKDPPVIGNSNINLEPTNKTIYAVQGRRFVMGVRTAF